MSLSVNLCMKMSKKATDTNTVHKDNNSFKKLLRRLLLLSEIHT